MRGFLFPCAVLAVILTASLAGGSYIGTLCDGWIGDLRAIEPQIGPDAEGDVSAAVEAIYDDWTSRQRFLHIVVEHDELDEAESLFARTRSCAKEDDAHELEANIAELITQLRHLKEMEQPRIENIF
ncbi:MAG: DUF4363 family protein [Oscillospiraceae bacterium]|nr:DUF4363 family protein [Oscillospiraceae bacterium]